MGMVKTAVRTQLCGLSSPQAVLERLNAVLPSVKEPHTYATCTALRIAGRNHGGPCVIEYAIAGQPAILHACARGGVVSHLADQQLPLGLLQGPPYVGHQVEALPGDVLLVVTDGIVEAADENDNEFGLDRLESLLLHNLTQPLAAIAQTISSSVRAHGKQTDDQTLLLIRVLP
jgi:sigma-B regulation protein RsbU (phosphoserine phosphatase)